MKHNLPPMPLIEALACRPQARIKHAFVVWGTVLTTLFLVSCSKPPVDSAEPAALPEVDAYSSGNLTDFGELRLNAVAAKMLSGQYTSHVIQLGDSHTAADFFTGALRTALQERYGDAGPGWVPPAWIRGQRSAALKLFEVAADQWQLTSSRLEQHANFPPGGFVLKPLRQGSRLQLAQYASDKQIFNVRALYSSPIPAPVRLNGQFVSWPVSSWNRWQWSAAQQVQLPLELEVLTKGYPQLGGWLLDNGQSGVLLSSLGMNGATIEMLDKWGEHWQAPLHSLQPDLILLSYGTNEAFNDALDIPAYYANLTRQIQQLRLKQPQAAVLIIGAPDVIKHAHASTCQAQRPLQLNQVQRIQRKVAREQHTLFWDWQALMGGACSFSAWQAQGLAQKDGVHFTAEGYTVSADGLFQDLKQQLESLKLPVLHNL